MAGTESALAAWRLESPMPLTAAGALALALLVCTQRSRRRALRWMCGCAGLCLVLALGRGVALTATATRLEAAVPGQMAVVVSEDPSTGEFGTTVTGRLQAVAGSPAVRISWPDGGPEPRYGELVRFDARLRLAERSSEFAADAFRSGELLRASPWRIRSVSRGPGVPGAIAAWRNDTVAALRMIGGRGAESLASMLFAARPQGAGAEALEDAKTAGVAWLVTASGIHLGAIVLLAERLAAAMGAGRRGRALAAAAAVCVIAIAAGLRLSLLRAALAAGVAVFARLVGRRRDATATLGAAILALVLLDPAAPYDVGLTIAVAAVSAIALIGPIARVWLRPLVGRTLSGALGASVTAQLGVAPLAASLFGAIAVAGPVVLALTAPVVQVAVVLGLVGAVTAAWSRALGSLMLRAGSGVAELATRVWGLAARIPGAVVAVSAVPPWAVVAWVGAGIALWLWWPSPRRMARVRCGAALVVTALAASGLASGLAGASLVVLDVGQGDAILVRDSGESVLVDVGADGTVLRQALARAGVRSIQGVVLTHAHDDHVGGIDGLTGLARPTWIGVPDVDDEAVASLATRTSRYTGRVLRLRQDMTFTVGRIHARVLWPRGGESGLSTNDTSVILLLERDGAYALLLGDAEDAAQLGALELWSRAVGTLKVAHHGSMNGNVPEALARWQPRLALISVGQGNRFGHPTAGALEELGRIGATVRRTDLEGDLAWTFPAGGAAVSTRSASEGVEAGVGATALCDNPIRGRPVPGRPEPARQVDPWLPLTSTISNRSTSSTAPRSCCSSVPRSAFGTGSPLSPTSTSTSRPSTAARPPPTTSSTRRTRCRS